MKYSEAVARRDRGMSLAADKANRDSAGWTEAAMRGLEKYISAHDGDFFLTEQVRAWCEELELVDEPANSKAWGSVMQKAARDGMIKRYGYAPAKSSNLSPKCLWGTA